MSRWGRRFVVAGLAATGLALVVALVVDFGGGPTTSATRIDGLHDDLLVVAVPIAVLVEGALVYAVWRFRNNDDPVPTPQHRRLELTWTLATGLVLVFVGVSAYQVLAGPAVTATPEPGADAVRVDVTAQQWAWNVAYPSANVSVQRADRIVLPADRPIRVTLRSTDVIHSFHAPALGLKQDAIPGQRRSLATRITRPGEYRLYCAEYCGGGHSRMRATIAVVPPAEYEHWLDDRRNATARAG